MKPLKEAADGPSPILDQRSIATLCGPIEALLEEHKLFYLALTQQALEWNRDSTIGAIFISSVSLLMCSSWSLRVTRMQDLLCVVCSGDEEGLAC